MSVLQQLFHAVFSILAGASVIFIALQIAKAKAWVDNLPDIVKMIATPVIGFVLAKASALFQFPLPFDLGGFTEDVVRGLLMAIGAFIEHKLFGQVITAAFRSARAQLG